MTPDAKRHALLLANAQLCRDIGRSVPTLAAAQLCECTAVEFEKLAATYSVADSKPLAS